MTDWTYFKNGALGGTLGFMTGFCLNKYTITSSMVGIGFAGISLVNVMDVNGDGKFNLVDVGMIEEKLDMNINWFGIVSYIGGVGIGLCI